MILRLLLFVVKTTRDIKCFLLRRKLITWVRSQMTIIKLLKLEEFPKFFWEGAGSFLQKVPEWNPSRAHPFQFPVVGLCNCKAVIKFQTAEISETVVKLNYSREELIKPTLECLIDSATSIQYASVTLRQLCCLYPTVGADEQQQHCALVARTYRPVSAAARSHYHCEDETNRYFFADMLTHLTTTV